MFTNILLVVRIIMIYVIVVYCYVISVHNGEFLRQKGMRHFTTHILQFNS